MSHADLLCPSPEVFPGLFADEKRTPLLVS